MQQISEAIQAFTRRYCDSWQQHTGQPPVSTTLADSDSPCIQHRTEHGVCWLPQPFTLPPTLSAVERGIEIALQPAAVAWYTSQFAADMEVHWRGEEITLLQVWNEDDFQRLQENLIGHLVMKRRLKQSPTLFIAATPMTQRLFQSAILAVKLFARLWGRRNVRYCQQMCRIF